MKIEVFAGPYREDGPRCDNGECPTAYKTDRNSYLIQGYDITDKETLTAVSAPQGESVVEIPEAFLRELAEKFARENA